MNNKTTAWILIILVAIVGAYFYFTRDSGPEEGIVASQVACTTEARICPDGSSVGRTGPDCTFAACPEPVVVKTATPAQPVAPADFYK
ncbi:MAG: hypothetical protein WC767_01475 [Candidatus Paceibacterota bacterium]